MKRVLILALAAAALSPMQSFAQGIETRIAQLLDGIRTEPNGDIRRQHTARLAEYIAAESNGTVKLEPRTIDGIAGLLADEEDWVRFYAAASLGFVGSDARRALPQLERALDRAKGTATLGAGAPEIFGGLGSANAICAAIGKIDLGRRPESCEGLGARQ